MHTLVIISCIALLAAYFGLLKTVYSRISRQSINTLESAENIALRAQLLNSTSPRLKTDHSTPTKKLISTLVPISRLVTVFFSYNSTAFHPTLKQRNAFLPYVQSAKQIQVRGYTDGQFTSKRRR